MQKSVFIAAAFALVLAGCAHHAHHPQHGQHHYGPRTAPNPHNPQVTVVGGTYVVVDQEPIVILKDDRNPIVWQLPQDSPYTFPDNGIVIDKAGEEFTCNVEKDKKRFTCNNRHSNRQKYQYTIRVMDGPKPLQSDPTVMND